MLFLWQVMTFLWQVWQVMWHVVPGRHHVHPPVRLPALLLQHGPGHLPGDEEEDPPGPVWLPQPWVVRGLRGCQVADPPPAKDGPHREADHHTIHEPSLDQPIDGGAPDSTPHGPSAAGGQRPLGWSQGGNDQCLGNHAGGLWPGEDQGPEDL